MNNSKDLKNIIPNNFNLEFIAVLEENGNISLVIKETLRKISDKEPYLVRNEYRCESVEELKEKAEMLINKYQKVIDDFKEIVFKIISVVSSMAACLVFAAK